MSNSSLKNWSLKWLWQNKIWLPIAGLVFLIQLAIPAYMIFEQQQTLKHGDLYKFKIRPIDPYDPFRGRYVVLSFDAQRGAIKFKKQPEKRSKRNDWVFAVLEEDEKGFAKISYLSLVEPANNNYLRVQASYSYKEDSAHIKLPFDRYYAPEDKALAIERDVRRNSRRNSEDNVYVAVKVRHGKGTIEDLYVNEMPVLQFVEQNRNQ